jgi:phage-related protein
VGAGIRCVQKAVPKRFAVQSLAGGCIYNDKVLGVTLPTLAVRFFRSSQGNEPVREWLRSLSATDRKLVGEEIRTVQLGWPIGMPVVRKLDASLWEIRVRVKDGIARVLFTVEAQEAILLHGFIKKSQRLPADDLHTALVRKKQLRGIGRR